MCRECGLLATWRSVDSPGIATLSRSQVGHHGSVSEQTPIGSSWRSTALRRVFLIEKVGAVDSWDEIFVFKAADRVAALQRALEIGRNREESYVNGDCDRVVWRFAEVMTLDELRADDLDGAEVYWARETVVSIADALLGDG